MKKLSILLVSALLALVSCTKSKEVHPEIGNGNDELITVGVNNVHIKYIRNDVASLQKVMFHYSISDAQQFSAAEMTKHSDCFTLTLNNLLSDTLYSYYYVLFPYNSNAYQTDQKTFSTQASLPTPPPVVVPTGAIDGLFTINANGDKVYFSQGNLQYQASTNTWRFAENQYDMVGGYDYNAGWGYGNVYEYGTLCDNSLISQTYSGWIDLFGWGTSGYNHGAICYQPWSSSPGVDYYYAYGDNTMNLNEQTGKADWGYNTITNGGNKENSWRTLSKEEWDYIFNIRNTTTGIRFVKAYVSSVPGILLLPDDWDSAIFSLNNINDGSSGFGSNGISDLNIWKNEIEANGAVFLPASGFRADTAVVYPKTGGWYAMTTYKSIDLVYCINFDDTYLKVDDHIMRSYGQSVRLVQNYNNR